jgi:hypothetical protein
VLPSPKVIAPTSTTPLSSHRGLTTT